MHRAIATILALSQLGCTSGKCANDSGCDSGEVVEEAQEIGPVTVAVNWQSGALLIVEITGLGEGTFGLAETGGGGGGWYQEDCISPGASYCHTVQDGTNSFVSVNELATGAPWDGTMDNNETLMHQEAAEKITWALFAANGDCVAVGGHDPAHYLDAGCINL